MEETKQISEREGDRGYPRVQTFPRVLSPGVGSRDEGDQDQEVLVAALTASVLTQGASAATFDRDEDWRPRARRMHRERLHAARGGPPGEHRQRTGPDRAQGEDLPFVQVGTDDDALAGDLDVTAGSGQLTIVGKGAGKTTIDGNDLDRLFQVFEGARATIERVALRGRNAVTGGGVLSDGRLT